MYQGLVDLTSVGFSSPARSSTILSCVVGSGTGVSWTAAGAATSAVPSRIGASRNVSRKSRPRIACDGSAHPSRRAWRGRSTRRPWRGPDWTKVEGPPYPRRARGVSMAHPVQVSLRIPGTSPMQELIRLIQDVEAAGFDGAGILDSQLLCRDTFVTLGQAATQTSRLTLFPAVTNPFSRHVSVLAGAIQTVAELTPGRTKVVIGTGYTSASTIGRKPATLAEMRACIERLRRLLSGDAVDFDGTPGRLAYAAGRPVPLLMAASGPKAIELAGEVADGVMLLVGFHRGIVDAVLTHLEKGARRSGRRLEDLEIVWAVRTCMAETMPEAQRQARPTVVHQGIMRVHSRWLEHTKLSIPHFEIPASVYKIYPDLSHAQDWEAAIAATSFLPDEVIARLCDALGWVGTPEHCAQRIIDLTSAGVRSLYIMAFQTFVGPEQEIRTFRDAVFPALKAAGCR